MLEFSIWKQGRGFLLNVALAARNGVVVLYGPSGSGKSLTLQCIAGLLRPDHGRIAVNGRTVFDSATGLMLPPQHRRVGYLPQGYGLFPHLTVHENIAYGLRGESTAKKRKVAEMMDSMRLQGLADRRPQQLSGGQQQRVALARALAVDPDILLLDEPFSALDSAIRSKLRRDLLEVLPRFRITTVLVTHDLAEAFSLGDQIAVLDDGKVLQSGSPEEVLYKPRTRTVARFVGAKNIFSGRVIGTSVDEAWVAVEDYDDLILVTQPFSSSIGELVDCCIRPEDIMLVRPDRPEGAVVRDNQVRGRIVAEIAEGSNYVLFFKIGHRHGGYRDYDLELHLQRPVYDRLHLAVDREWTVSLKKTAIHTMTRTGRDP